MIIANAFLGYIEHKPMVVYVEKFFDSHIVHFSDGSDILLQSDSDYVDFYLNENSTDFDDYVLAVDTARKYIECLQETL